MREVLISHTEGSPGATLAHTALSARSLWLPVKFLFPRDMASCHHFLFSAKSLQSCLTLCNPVNGSPSGSPVPGILQARTLEWVAISFSFLFTLN